MPVFRDIPRRTGLQRTECSASNAVLSRLFSGRHMSSPVSRRALGECNAIRSWGFGRRELTFSVSGKPISTLPASPERSALAHQFIE